MIFARCAVVQIVTVLCAGCGAADLPADGPPPAPPLAQWTPPDAPGPYAVSVTTRTMGLVDGDRPPVTVEIWYPARPEADAPPGAYMVGPLRVDAGVPRDAPPDVREEPFPLLSFSHGFGGVRFQNHTLAEHLASHGVVVVAPDHPGTSLVDYRPSAAAASAARRPAEVRDAVDAVGLVDGLQVDTSRYVAVGHSFGSFTSAILAGGALDVPGFAAACAEDPRPGPACGFVDGQALDADAAARWAVPDDRVVAAVLITPGVAYGFGRAGVVRGDVPPPLLLGGGLDGDLPWDREGAPVFDALGAPRSLALFARAGHFGFTDLCAVLPVADCVGEPDFQDPARILAATTTIVTAWARRALGGDVRDGDWLDGATAYDGVAWTVVDAP